MQTPRFHTLMSENVVIKSQRISREKLEKNTLIV